MRLDHHDGANWQARVVLEILRNTLTINDSWDKKRERYAATFEVNRWHNCREQGYTVSMLHNDCPTGHHATFYEHRNTDSVCVLFYTAHTVNPPTLDTLPKGFYNSKWDVSESFAYREWEKAAQSITNYFNEKYTIFIDQK